jgi:hypothetical protein
VQIGPLVMTPGLGFETASSYQADMLADRVNPALSRRQAHALRSEVPLRPLTVADAALLGDPEADRLTATHRPPEGF